MSTINTNGIDVNYPVPGENNSSQGFRTNFTNIKDNIDVAGEEITELQNKAVLKSPISGLSLNNDMANTLISNAAVRSFRHTTYNLGTNLSGTVVINATLADVHLGTITGNTTLQIAGWAPAGTRSDIQLNFTIANREAYIIFPGTVTGSAEILENNEYVGGNLAIATAPYSVTNLIYDLSTIDCGNTVTISPSNRPYQAGQIETRLAVTPTGFQGDKNGDLAVTTSIQPVTIVETSPEYTAGSFTIGDTYTILTSGDTDFTLIGAADSNPGTQFVATGTGTGTGTAQLDSYVAFDPVDTLEADDYWVGMAVEFTSQGGNTVYGGLSAGTTYYVGDVVTGNSTLPIPTFSMVKLYTDEDLTTPWEGTNVTSTMQMSPINYQYVAVADYDSTAYAANIANVSSNTVGLTTTPTPALSTWINAPIVFTGPNVENGGLKENTTYYIKSAPTTETFTVSRTRTTGGVAGVQAELTDTIDLNATYVTVYIEGHDIWKRIQLQSF